MARLRSACRRTARSSPARGSPRQASPPAYDDAGVPPGDRPSPAAGDLTVASTSVRRLWTNAWFDADRPVATWCRERRQATACAVRRLRLPPPSNAARPRPTSASSSTPSPCPSPLSRSEVLERRRPALLFESPPASARMRPRGPAHPGRRPHSARRREGPPSAHCSAALAATGRPHRQVTTKPEHVRGSCACSTATRLGTGDEEFRRSWCATACAGDSRSLVGWLTRLREEPTRADTAVCTDGGGRLPPRTRRAQRARPPARPYRVDVRVASVGRVFTGPPPPGRGGPAGSAEAR